MNINKFLFELRFDQNHHLGLGDIRITAAQQAEIANAEAALRAELENTRRLHTDAEKYKNQYAGRIVDMENEARKARAERDELRAKLDKMSDIAMRLLGKLPYGENPYAIGYVETCVNAAREVLAKYEGKE